MTVPPNERLKLGVLVVDDSAYNRQTITSMLEADGQVEVIGRATNGKEALKLAFDLEPDVITLDLETPELAGFAFLRLLMTKRPTPVIVISGYSHHENVFRALELGALDFIAKPGRHISPNLRNIQEELCEKIALVARLTAVRLQQRARTLAALRTGEAAQAFAIPSESPSPRLLDGPAPPVLIGIAASTGGPPAVQQLLSGLDPSLPIAVVVSQHMPSRFTRAFAERLDKLIGFRVVEAEDWMPLVVGVVYITPGASNLELQRTGQGTAVVRVVAPPVVKTSGITPITPCADHMFKSAAAAFGKRLCALVLTGMGSDGREGARVAHEAGARVLAEDPSTAVMPGMPQSVVETGTVDEVLPLEELPAAVVRFIHKCGS